MKARRLIAWCPLLLLACGCRIDPPLFLRQAIDLDIELQVDLDVDRKWQADWKARWIFPWNARALGELGYEAPASVRMHSYAQDAGSDVDPSKMFNFQGMSGRIRLIAGTYDFLFYNNDSEALLFDTKILPDDVYAYTRVVSPGLQLSSPVLTALQKRAGTKADVEMKAADDPVVLQPDALFSLSAPEQTVSDDPADCELVDGHPVVRFRGTLTPATYIWLIQIRLLNNAGRVIGSTGGCALTGMAEGVDLKTNVSGATNVTVPTDVHVESAADPDLLGARLVSFGIPGCDPYDPASIAAAPAGEHFLVLNVAYNNGTSKNIHVDLTDQVRALPTGGVITLELDVDDFPPESGGQGSGFSAIMKDWDEHVGEFVITQ